MSQRNWLVRRTARPSGYDASRIALLAAPLILLAGLGACTSDGAGQTDGVLDASVAEDSGNDGSLFGHDASIGETSAIAPDAGHEPEVDRSAALFEADHVLDVSITMAPADYTALKAEGRSMIKLLSGCELTSEYDYTQFHAQIVVDGQAFSDVAVRKKGLLGSLSMQHPSIRVDLDEYVTNQELQSESVLTFNNSLQDRTLSHQCIAYALFERAGIASPRCNFAHLRVNGEDLGSYVHVEAIKKPFLKRRFGSAKGDLYEGAAADFTPGKIDYLEKKTNEDEPRSPEVDALIAALTVADSELVAALAPLLDLDEFMRFWATEVLIAEGDGYSSNQNNYFIYVHPDTRKIHFIPWGTDGTLSAPNIVAGPTPQPVSVYAKGRLTRRLYDYAPTRDQYRKTLQMLLDTIWDEAALDKELDRITQLTGVSARTASIAAQRTFFEERRAALQKELDGAPPSWTQPEPGVPACHPEMVRTISGTFNVPMGTDAAPGVSVALDSSVMVELSKGPVQPLVALGFGGTSESGTAFGLIITQLDGSQVQLVLISQRTDLGPGDLPFHGFETFGMVQSGPDGDHLRTEGYISDGMLHFSELKLGAGGIAKGHFEGKLVLVEQ